jgi:phospholipid transport system substrate-binding protein
VVWGALVNFDKKGKNMRMAARRLVFVLVILFSFRAFAAESLSAHQVMEKTTAEIMLVLAEAETERYYQEIHRLLDDLVDFNAFARGVMGSHASSKYYQSLNAEQRVKLRKQVQRFSSVIRVSLVRTYGKGLLVFSDSEAEIQSPSKEEDSSNSATVVQLIRGSGVEPVVIRYKMRKTSKNGWMMRNLTVGPVNLGKIYKSQFQSAFNEYQGDVDKVIDTWALNSSN